MRTTPRAPAAADLFPQLLPVTLYLIVKGLVCLMVYLGKVCGAFIIDRAIHEIHKDEAACQYTGTEKQRCHNREDTAF